MTREYQQLTGNSTKESSGDLACTQPEPSVLHAPASSEMASSKTCRAQTEWTWAEQTGTDRRYGSQVQTGAAASGTATTHTDLFRSSNCCNPPSNPSHNTSTTQSPANATTKASGSALQSTASLFILPSTSLLLRDAGQDMSVRPHFLNPIQMAWRHPATRKKQVFVESSNSTPYFTDTENVEDLKFGWFEEHGEGLTR